MPPHPCRYRFRLPRVALGLLICLCALCASAAPPEASVRELVITATVGDHSISALVSHQAEHGVFKRGVLLMPGHPGIMKIQSAESFGMKGNFLIRSRKAWLDAETIVFSVDAPSDEWYGFTVYFRSTPRYATDVQALVQAIRAQYSALALAVVGTSEGSVSAYYVARALDDARVKVIFSSSLFQSSKNSRGLNTLDFEGIQSPMLWVHHASDPCKYTSYSDAQRMAEKTRTPLLTVRSSNAGTGNPCEARSPHGYIGAEQETVAAMKAWLVQGVVADVVLP